MPSKNSKNSDLQQAIINHQRAMAFLAGGDYKSNSRDWFTIAMGAILIIGMAFFIITFIWLMYYQISSVTISKISGFSNSTNIISWPLGKYSYSVESYGGDVASFSNGWMSNGINPNQIKLNESCTFNYTGMWLNKLTCK